MAERRIDGKWRIGGKMAEMAENGGSAEVAEFSNPPFPAISDNTNKNKIKNLNN